MRARHTSPARRVRRWVNGVLLAVLAVTVVLGGFAVLSGSYQVRPVLSGSMRPGLPVGGVVITQRVPVDSLRVRDVVVFHRPDEPGELVVHRIISLTQGPTGAVIRTQGDANDAPDPWRADLAGDTAYRAVFSVPYVGYAAVWAHSPQGRRSYVIVGLVLVLAALAGTVTQRFRKRQTAATRRLHAVMAPKPGSAPLGDHALRADHLQQGQRFGLPGAGRG